MTSLATLPAVPGVTGRIWLDTDSCGGPLTQPAIDACLRVDRRAPR